MFVGDLEKIIAVQLAQRWSSSIEDKIDKLSPPTFVVVFARAIDRVATRHCVPGVVECAIEFPRIEFQSDFLSDERIMITDPARQMKEGAGRIEKDRFWRRLFVVCRHERTQSMESRFTGPCNLCCG